MSLDNILYQFGRLVVTLYTQLMFHLDVLWHAPLPSGPKIIVANHPTTTDPFVITALIPEHTHILINETLFKVPMFGPYLRQAGHVPVVMENGHASFEQAQRLIESGHTIAIFPEGAISPLVGGFHKPHTGAARLSLATGAPIVPVGIHLRRDLIRLIETQVEDKIEVGTWYLRGPYAMTVGQAMHLRGNVEDRPHVRQVSEQVMQRIAWLSQQSALRLHRPIPAIDLIAEFLQRGLRFSDM